VELKKSNLENTMSEFISGEGPVMVLLDDILGGDPNRFVCAENEFQIRGLTVKTWTYTSSAFTGVPRLPVIALHGGPSFCHNYILPLKLLADSGYPVIFYDQAGCGKSSFISNPESDAPWLLTLGYYSEELATLIDNLSLQEYYIFGSSWGTIVAQEFAVQQPSGLRGLILDGALSDAQLYISTQWRDRISSLPTFTQNLLKSLIQEEKFDSPVFQALDETISKHFTCRLLPRPDCWYASVRGANGTIYSKMQGHCEFMIGGVLEKWSITDQLHRITVPTIVLAGQFDTMTEECSLEIVKNIPYAWPLVTIPRASHCKLIDEPHACAEVIVKFLSTVDAVRKG